MLLVVASWPTLPEDRKPLTAIFITAPAGLADDNFAGSTLLVMNNLGPAPIGVILNRPTKFPVSDLFPNLKRLQQVHERVFFGGPVDLQTVWFLVRAVKPPEHAIRAVEGVYLSASRELLFRLLERDKPMEGLRLFIGHAGWAPGQLEAEIGRGDWTLGHADPDAIFDDKSNHPWPSERASQPST